MKKLKRFIMIFVMVFTTVILSSCALKKMPVPSVKEARFNFSFTYEINGEEETYSGVYVCKYDGTYASVFGFGTGVDWIGYVENVGEEP